MNDFFLHPVFDEARKKLAEEYAFIDSPYIFDEKATLSKCKFCNSKRTVTYNVQDRSGDEATSVFTKCIDCGRTKRSNN